MSSRTGALANKNLSADCRGHVPTVDYIETDFLKFKTEVSEDLNNLRVLKIKFVSLKTLLMRLMHTSL